MTTLSGCRMIAERGFKDLGEVYPTENVYHLFNKFPKGFIISNWQHFPDKVIQIKIEGNAKTREVSGFITINPDEEKYSDLTGERLSTFEGQIMVDTNGKLIVTTPPPAEYQSYLDNFFFLFQKLDLSSEKLSSFSLDETGSNANSTHWIWYTVNHPELATYLKSKDNNVYLHLERQAGEGVWGFEKTIEITTKEVTIHERIWSEGKVNDK